MSAQITDTDRGLAAFAARLAGNVHVMVGVLDDAPKQFDTRKTVAGKRQGKADHQVVTFGDKATLLEVAAIHEFGGGHVPQRSFIRATIDENLDRIHALQAALARRIVLAEITADQAMEQLGAAVKGMIQQRIARGIDPPNAASTVAKKGSSKPLIDTGQLRASIDYRVERGP